MQRVTPRLAVDTFKIFIHHYFSFSWLREFILEKRVFEIVRYDDEEEEAYYLSESPGSEEGFQSFKNDRVRMYSDLMFLIRVCHDGVPTPEILHAIMGITEVCAKRPTELMKSIYFTEAIQRKISSPNQALSQLWRKVLRIPRQDQCNYTYYCEAKLAEMALLGYKMEKDSQRALRTDSGQTIVNKWVSNEYEFQEQLEREKTIQDFAKYFHSLSSEAKLRGNEILAKKWEIISCDEMQGNSVEKDILLAWSLRRAKDPLTGRIWGGVSKLVEETSWWSEYAFERHSAYSVAQLAFATENNLEKLRKWELQVKNLQCSETNENALVLKEIFEGIPTMLRLKYEDQIKADSDNFECLKDWRRGVDALLSCFKDCFIKIKEIVEARRNLIAFFEGYPHLVNLVEMKFKGYCHGISTDFRAVDITAESNSYSLRMQNFPSSEVGCLLQNFPFKSELVFFSSKSNEGLQDSSFYSEVKHAILKIYSIGSEKGTFQWQSISLADVKFAVTSLQTPNLSELKRQLLLEYLKSSIELLSYYISKNIGHYYRYSYQNDIISDSMSKIQKYFGDNSFQDNCPSQTATNWKKAFEILKKLPTVQGKVKNVFPWLIAELTEQKPADGRLFDSIAHQIRQQKISFLFALTNVLPN
jgi:hypothetical protein